MPREFIKLTFFGILYFVLLALFRNYFEITYIAFFLGGLLGLFLPYVDAFVYVYVLRPHELSSQRVTDLMSKSKFRQAIQLVFKTNSERSSLVFHTVLFQLVFSVFAFYVMSSSTNQLGRGIVLGFLLHYLVLQFSELLRGGDLAQWFESVNVRVTRQSALFYCLIQLGFLFLLGLNF